MLTTAAAATRRQTSRNSRCCTALLLNQLSDPPLRLLAALRSWLVQLRTSTWRADPLCRRAAAAAAAAAPAPPINLSRTPLSTYSLPLRQPKLVAWLEACMRDAVRNLEQAPFVQLYLPGQRSDVIKRHKVTEHFVQAPQVCHATEYSLATHSCSYWRCACTISELSVP